MNKKILAIIMSIVLVAGIVCAFAACNNDAGTTADPSETEAPASDIAYIKDKGEMIIGITYFAPMNYLDENNELIGFETEFAKAVGEKLGVEVKFQVIEWNSKEVELATKNIDCIWNGMTITPEREENMQISIPYMKNKQAVVVAD